MAVVRNGLARREVKPIGKDTEMSIPTSKKTASAALELTKRSVPEFACCPGYPTATFDSKLVEAEKT